MEKLSQLPQPLKRASPRRDRDVTHSNSPLPRRVATDSPLAARSSRTAVAKQLTVNNAPTNRLSPKRTNHQPDVSAHPSSDFNRAPTGSRAISPGGKPTTAISNQQQQSEFDCSAHIVAATADTKQSPVKSLAAKLKPKSPPTRTKSPRSIVDKHETCTDAVRDNSGLLWNGQLLGSSCKTSASKKTVSPLPDRRSDGKTSLVVDEDGKNTPGSGGSPIYHELDPPGSYQFPAVQHTYQSIVEISDELESLRQASAAAAELRNDAAASSDDCTASGMARTKSAQELAPQKSPTKLSLFSRFRFATKKSGTGGGGGGTSKSAESARGKVAAPSRVVAQRSLQDCDLLAKRDEYGSGGTSSHDRQPSFSSFASRSLQQQQQQRQRCGPAKQNCSSDGYSSVYDPDGRTHVITPPPRNSSLSRQPADTGGGNATSTITSSDAAVGRTAVQPLRSHDGFRESSCDSSLSHQSAAGSNGPRASNTSSCAAVSPPEPLYRQKFLKIASVHTLRSTVDESRGRALTTSNSLGNLLLSTDVCHSPSLELSERSGSSNVTSFDDDYAVPGDRRRDVSLLDTLATYTPPAAGSRSRIARRSPARGAVSSYASPSCGVRMAEMRGAVRRGSDAPRSPSVSTPVPSPGVSLSVFQFSVPPPGVMLSPPCQRAYRHVSSQTVVSVRPPSAACTLTVNPVLTSPSAAPGLMQTIVEEDDEDSTAARRSESRSTEDLRQRGETVAMSSQQASHTVCSAVRSSDAAKAGQENPRDRDVVRAASVGSVGLVQVATVSKVSKLRRPSPCKTADSSPRLASPARHSNDPTAPSSSPSRVSSIPEYIRPGCSSDRQRAYQVGVQPSVARGATRQPAPPAECQTRPSGECLQVSTDQSAASGSHTATSPQTTTDRRRLVPLQQQQNPAQLSTLDTLAALTNSSLSSGSNSSVSLDLDPIELNGTDQPRDSSSPQHIDRTRLLQTKHSSVVSRVGKLNELSLRRRESEHVNY